MIIFDGRNVDPDHEVGTHVITHRMEIGRLRSALAHLQSAILDNQPVRAWIKSEEILDIVNWLDRDERRGLPEIEVGKLVKKGQMRES
jgi:hypothetical protein